MYGKCLRTRKAVSNWKQTITETFYKDAKGILIVFDVTDKTSYDEAINSWLERIKDTNVDGEELRLTAENAVVMLVANKIDLPADTWQVDQEEILSFLEPKGRRH